MPIPVPSQFKLSTRKLDRVLPAVKSTFPNKDGNNRHHTHVWMRVRAHLGQMQGCTDGCTDFWVHRRTDA